MTKVPKSKPKAGAKKKSGQKTHVAGAGQAKIRDTARAGRAEWGYLPYGRGGRPAGSGRGTPRKTTPRKKS